MPFFIDLSAIHFKNCIFEHYNLIAFAENNYYNSPFWVWEIYFSKKIIRERRNKWTFRRSR